MKKTILLSLVLLAFAACSKQGTGNGFPETIVSEQEPGTLKVMSFNVRSYTTEDDIHNNWCMRADAVRDMFFDQKASLVGFQELSEGTEWEYVRDVVVPHGYAAISEEAAKGTVLYLQKDLEPLRDGYFWQSTTPDRESLCWDGYNRFVRWVEFRIKATDKRFFYVNAHMGLTADARRNGFSLVNNRIKMYNTDNLPVVFTADCNTPSTDSVFKTFRETMVNAQEVAPITDTVKTYNAWGNEAKAGIIDFIWFTKDGSIQCSEYKTVTTKYAGHKYVSDHYPIYAILKF